MSPGHASDPGQNPQCTDSSGNTGIHLLASGSTHVCLAHAAREENKHIRKSYSRHYYSITEMINKSQYYYHAVLSYLNSLHPFTNILLLQLQPLHCALSVCLVVPPLTRVNVTRRVAVSKQTLASAVKLHLRQLIS